MIGQMRKNSFCTRLVLILSLAWVAESQLYPYGTSNGDAALTKQNDIAQRVALDRAFPFGGKYHSTLYIGDNGVISFDDAVSQEADIDKFRNLPFFYDVDGDGQNEDPDTIFAFWADVDITDAVGNVYYRVTTSTAILDQATTDVRTYFRSNVDFSAQVVIVVTWDQVSFFNQEGTSDPRNTFQAVLIHDGRESFVLFLYESIEWVVGTRMGGDSDTGVYPDTKIGIAIVGFVMGDGEIVKDFTYPQNTLLALNTDSNVDVNGVYAYKVDGTSVIDPVCDVGPGAALSITPARCGMMGGEKIYLYGPCWAVELVQTCVFSYGGEIIQQVNATVIDSNEAYCVPDPFFLVGEVTITVVKAGDEFANSPSTIYSIIESGRVTPTVTRLNSDTSLWDKAENSLAISWDTDQESFGTSDSALSITILAYREDNPGPRWENVYLISNGTADDGSYTFTPTAQVDVTEENAFGVIQITGMDNGRQRVLWSDIHPLGYLLEQSYQDDSVMWASEKCNEWITADNAKGSFLENIPACPCTLDQAEEDVGTFITDPSCYPDGGVDACAENEGAIYCFLSAYASPETMSGTKCCYDTNRLLMHSGDTMYAGMAGRSHIRGSSPYMERNLVPELSHWSNDVIAKHFCCEWAGEKECFDYITLRPTSDCVDYEPPNNALAFGDPHFITMDRYNFTFNGLGEFTLLRYATSGSKTGAFDFELQGRQIKTMDSNGREVAVTQLSSVAMKDSGSDSIFVEASATSGMEVYRKSMDETGEWQSVYFSQQTFTDLQGCAVGVTRFERDVEIYGVVVMFKETGIGVHVTYDYGMLAVRPILPSTLDSENLFGLLGNMDGDPSNDLVSRNNNNPLEDPSDEEIFQFGQSWEIEADYSLFRYVSGRGHSDYHNSTFVPRMNVNLPTLYPACNDVSQCLFDYEVSNDDKELAMATLGIFEAFESSSESIRKIDACPYQITPYNGTKTYSSYSNKYFEDAEVAFTCGKDLIMVGSSFKQCVYSADVGALVWTGSTGDNECIESSCGVLDTPSNGSILLSEDGRTATFTCLEGFTMNGISQSVCQDAAWTVGAPTCTESSCGVLDTPSNGSILLSEDGRTATFTCLEGFTMNGISQSVCRDAAWTSGAPTCTESSCGVLDTPSNGSILLSEDGRTATFTCLEGFTMNGISQSVCRDAAWTVGAPTCTESSCGVLDTPSNGSILLSEDGRTATFTCLEGFTMNGISQSVCRDAAWTSGAPTCTESSCGVLDTPSNGSILLSEDSLTATFTCLEGFTLNGISQSVCRDATWTSGAPTCTKSSCGVLDTPSNGSILLSEDGLKAIFTCHEGFTLNGTSQSLCRDATWTSGAPTCTKSSCGVLDTPSNGSILLSEDGLTATFTCLEGFTMNGISQSVCRDAAWTSGAPTCTADPEIDLIPGDNNAVVIALSVVFSIIFIVLLVVGIFVFLRYWQSGQFNTDKQEPNISTKEVEVNLGMENDTGNLGHIKTEML